MRNLRTHETCVGTHGALGLRARSNSIFKTAFRALVIGVMAVGFVPLANASLIGDTITVTTTANFPVDTWSDTVVVGAGAELVGGDGSNHSNTNQGQNFEALFPGDFIDIGANSITIHYDPVPIFGFPYAFITKYEDLDWTDAPGILTGLELAPGAVGLSDGFQLNVLSEHSFEFQGTVDLIGGADFTINLITEHIVAVIPLPAALPLYGTGLAVMGFLGWRRKRKAAAAA